MVKIQIGEDISDGLSKKFDLQITRIPEVLTLF